MHHAACWAQSPDPNFLLHSLPECIAIRHLEICSNELMDGHIDLTIESSSEDDVLQADHETIVISDSDGENAQSLRNAAKRTASVGAPASHQRTVAASALRHGVSVQFTNSDKRRSQGRVYTAPATPIPPPSVPRPTPLASLSLVDTERTAQLDACVAPDTPLDRKQRLLAPPPRGGETSNPTITVVRSTAQIPSKLEVSIVRGR